MPGIRSVSGIRLTCLCRCPPLKTTNKGRTYGCLFCEKGDDTVCWNGGWAVGVLICIPLCLSGPLYTRHTNGWKFHLLCSFIFHSYRQRQNHAFELFWKLRVSQHFCWGVPNACWRQGEIRVPISTLTLC
jgi:hypothetical protein